MARNKRLIAKTIIGKEYMRSRTPSYFVYENAEKIVSALNNAKHGIKDGEKWHVYDYDFSMENYVERRIWMTRNGIVRTGWL